MKKSLLFLGLVLFSLPVFADEETEAPPIIILNLGNDILGAQQSDRYLTNSFTLGVVTGDLPRWLAKYINPNPNTEYAISLNQQMYTPEDLDVRELIEDDRPYAGWLFVRLQTAKRRDNRLSINAIEIGVVGPASMAEDLQVAIHELTGSEPALGWNNQLSNEFGMNLIHVEAIGKRWSGDKIDHDVVAYVGGSLGNVQTHADVGAIYRVGLNVPDDMAVNYMGGNTIGTRRGYQDFSAYIFIGASGEYVIRDIFLDGNTFVDSHSVEKEDLVGSLQTGFVVAYKVVEVGYSNNLVTEQFKNQDGANHHGVVYLRFRKRF